MLCINPDCTSTETKVVETTKTPEVIWRRRCCPECGNKYVTVETFAKQQTVPRKKRRKSDAQNQQ